MPAVREIAVVTGAGRGLGRAIARALAARGYAVLATDLDVDSAEATARELGDGAWAMQLDVRDPAAHRLAAAAAAERGRLAVWVNNAGVLRTQKAWEHPDDDLRLTVEINLLGTIWGSRAAVDAMRESPERGDIINMASVAAFAPVPGLAAYAATKHAVMGFTTSLQGDLQAAGLPIRAHVVCPDATDTDMVRERVNDPDAAALWSLPLIDPERVAQQAVSTIDGRRIVVAVPAARAWLVRVLGPFPRVTLQLLRVFRWMGERRRPPAEAVEPGTRVTAGVGEG